MKKNFKKALAIFIIGFLVIFISRMIFVTNHKAISQEWNGINVQMDSVTNVKANYASSRTIVMNEPVKSVTVDQKYEKIGNISATTKDFDNDNKKIRDTIKSSSAVIQYENNSGTSGNRVLDLSIGVYPDKFDQFIEKIKTIGEINNFRIIKNDKTSEYKNLIAQQNTLQSTKKALVSLKENGGSIADLISLENRILDIEQQLQGLGVQLGNYNEENELCTVKVTLKEKGADKMKVLKDSFDALLWSAGCYALIIISIILTLLCLMLLLIFIDKIRKTYSNMINSTNI